MKLGALDLTLVSDGGFRLDGGIEVTAPKLDLGKAHRYKARVVDKNAKGIEFLFKKNKISGIHGFGRRSPVPLSARNQRTGLVA